MTSGRKRDAENALWHALEERRENLRAAQLWTGRTEQQHRKHAAAYDDGRLIDALVETMERRARSSTHSPVHPSQMAMSQAGFRGDSESRILSSGEETLRGCREEGSTQKS